MNKTTTEMVDILQKFREDYVNHKNMTIEVGILLSDLVQEFIILNLLKIWTLLMTTLKIKLILF